MPVRKIISGGQTGADRGALDAAIALGLERGGWAPRNWRAEDGAIPELYRVGMQQCASASYEVRTVLNVGDSDGTLVLSLGPLNGGSQRTMWAAADALKPAWHVIVRRDGWLSESELTQVRGWLTINRILTLNVAGPRSSKARGMQAAACAALVQILKPLTVS